MLFLSFLFPFGLIFESCICQNNNFRHCRGHPNSGRFKRINKILEDKDLEFSESQEDQ